MRVISANRAAISSHRDRLQSHTLICAQIADQMAIIGMQSIFFAEVKVIAIFHVKFAAPHHPKAWPDFIAKLPLHLIERQRQIFVTINMGAKYICEHFFCSGRKQHIATLTVLHPQHFFAIAIKPSAFTP